MEEYKNEQVSVDKDILDSLRVFYFGANNDPFKAASFRAYRDFNRTLRLENIEVDVRLKLRNEVTDIIRQRITKLSEEIDVTQESFDKWHQETCDMIREPYEKVGIEFSWGQAQKWINMTIKYLYVIGSCSFDGIFQFCHVPVDNYVIHIAKQELKLTAPKYNWSKWTYSQYVDYQGKLRSRIHNLSPLRWELKSWVKEARRLKKDSIN